MEKAQQKLDFFDSLKASTGCLVFLVRAWGFEPQRISAQEPKGDVTSVRGFQLDVTLIENIKGIKICPFHRDPLI